MTPSGESDSRVWVNPKTGGVESTAEWQRRLNAGDPEAHRQLAELAKLPPGTQFSTAPATGEGDSHWAWRVGVWPDHGAPLEALSDEDLHELRTDAAAELRRREAHRLSYLDRSDSDA